MGGNLKMDKKNIIEIKIDDKEYAINLDVMDLLDDLDFNEQMENDPIGSDIKILKTLFIDYENVKKECNNKKSKIVVLMQKVLKSPQFVKAAEVRQ